MSSQRALLCTVGKETRLSSSLPGIHGWYALEPPLATSSDAGGGRGLAGGVEISVAFTNEETRDLVVTDGLRLGWRAPDVLQLPIGGSCSTEHAQKTGRHFGGKSLKFEIAISHVDLQLSAIEIPTASRPAHKYCFLRYRFFDRSESFHRLCKCVLVSDGDICLAPSLQCIQLRLSQSC